jgi:hypothetical protein
MPLRIVSKRTNGGSVLLAAELSKAVADKHSSDYLVMSQRIRGSYISFWPWGDCREYLALRVYAAMAGLVC